MANFSIIADVMVRGLDSLKRLAGASEEVANETDEASDALGRFGKASGKAGKAADRASVDLEDAASKFRAMGSSGTLAGDTLERFSIIKDRKSTQSEPHHLLKSEALLLLKKKKKKKKKKKTC